MTDNLLTLAGVAVGYGRKVIVSNVNLALPRGSLVGLFGVNGSGKSTLLKTILGIIPPIAGKIQFGPANGHPATLGYVPQRDTLDPIFPLSVFEVVLMGASGRVAAGRGFGGREREFARECLRQTGVEELAEERFPRLSGGQLQRVLIARALVSKPDLLLLDEPTAGIDAAATQALVQLLKQLNEQRNMTILVVTHDLAVAREYVRQVIWLHEGRATQGLISELLTPEKVQQMLKLPAS